MGDTVQDQRQKIQDRLRRRKERLAQGIDNKNIYFLVIFYIITIFWALVPEWLGLLIQITCPPLLWVQILTDFFHVGKQSCFSLWNIDGSNPMLPHV